MRSFASFALIAGLGVAAAAASATAEARPYIEVAVPPPGLYVPYVSPYGAPYYARYPYLYPHYARWAYGYGPREFHRHGYFHGDRWHR